MAPDRGANPRARRLRAPLLLALWVLLGFEAAGGLVLFTMRLTTGRSPGETLHVLAGAALALAYAAYQTLHWRRVAPFRARFDYALGLISALCMILTLTTGFALAGWWLAKSRIPAAAGYPPALSAVHNIGSMLVLTFAGAHLVVVLARDRRA